MSDILTALKNLVSIGEREAAEAGEDHTPWLDEARSPIAAHTGQRFEVQQYMFCDGWANTWTADGQPLIFATAAEAQAALDDYLSDIEDQIADGDRHPEHGYERIEFRIMPTTEEPP